MAKKFELNLKTILTVVAAVLGLVAFFMMFAPALTSKLGDYKGTEIAFGSGEKIAASAYMLAYILVIIGVVASVVAVLGIGGKIVPLVAAVCLLVGGIFFFLPASLAMPYTGELSGDAKDKYVELFREGVKEMDLGAGAIVGGILSILGAVAVAVPVFIKK